MTPAREPSAQPACLPKTKLERPYNGWVAPALPTRPTLALCATEAEVAYFAGPSQPKPDALIALTPQAACACRVGDIPYRTVESFFDITAFWHGDEPMLSLQRRWTADIDAFLWEALPDLRERGYAPASTYFFFLKVVVDMLFRAVFGLSHLLLASEGGRLYHCHDPHAPSDTPEHWGRDTLFFNEPLYEPILSACAAMYGVRLTACMSQTPTEAHDVGDADAPTPGDRLSRRLFSRLPPTLRAAVRSTRDGGATVSWLLALRHAPEIVFGGTYDVDGRYLERQGFRVVTPAELVKSAREALPDAELQRQLAELWPRLAAEPFFREPFFWCGVDVFGAAESRLRYWWHTIVPTMARTREQARGALSRRRPRAVVFSSQWSVLDFAVTSAAQSLGVPVVTFQHGGFEGNCEYTTYDMTDLRQSDYRLVYGEGTARYLRERAAGRAGERLAEAIPVGSARLDALRLLPDERAAVRERLGVASDRPLVLYVPTACQFSSWYMARQSYVSTPYFEFLAEVLDLFGRFPDLDFVYKPFPEVPQNPIAGLFAERGDSFHVSSVAVPQLMQASDLIVLDIPSTALLEGLLTTKPLVVHADERYIALRPEARELLQRRVLLTETPHAFLASLATVLQRGRFEPADPADPEFLRAYGTYLDDGRSAERAVEALRAVIRERARPEARDRG